MWSRAVSDRPPLLKAMDRALAAERAAVMLDRLVAVAYGVPAGLNLPWLQKLCLKVALPLASQKEVPPCR